MPGWSSRCAGRFSLAWAAAAVYVALNVAAPTSSPGDLVSLVPKHAPALEAARRAASAFDVPFGAEVSVVERDPHGLSVQEQRRAVGQALAIDRPSDGSDPPFVVLPVTNTAGAVPGSRESSTAVISYFQFPPATSLVRPHGGRRPVHGRRPPGGRAGGGPHRDPARAAARGDDRRGRAALRRGGHDPDGCVDRRAQVPIVRCAGDDARHRRDRLPHGAARHRAAERGNRRGGARHPEAAHGRARPRDRDRLHHLLRLDHAVTAH